MGTVLCNRSVARGCREPFVPIIGALAFLIQRDRYVIITLGMILLIVLLFGNFLLAAAFSYISSRAASHSPRRDNFVPTAQHSPFFCILGIFQVSVYGSVTSVARRTGNRISVLIVTSMDTVIHRPLSLNTGANTCL